MLKKIIFAITIVLCLEVAGCGDINEPIIINDTSQGGGDFGQLARTPKISPILTESDLIIVGEVYEAANPENPFATHIKITEVLKGTTTENKVQVNSNHRLIENGKCILFLRKERDCYVFTQVLSYFYNPSIIHIESPYSPEKDDVKLLLNGYKKNKKLFSKTGKQDLFNLYSQLQSGYIKSAVENDLEDLFDENDIEFFANGLMSDNAWYNLFSIKKIGEFRIEQFKETIADLLITTTDTIQFYYLLPALGNYADMKYKDIFFGYLELNGMGYIRNLSYEAIGKLDDEETLLALAPYYGNEEEPSFRSTILTALEKIKNNDVLIPVLLELKEIETEEHLINRIDDIIEKRIGG